MSISIKIPVVRIEEVQSQSAHSRHSAVRVLYHTKTAFKKAAKALGIMDDFKAGVPRMAYRGVVSVMNRSVSWSEYSLVLTKLKTGSAVEFG